MAGATEARAGSGPGRRPGDSAHQQKFNRLPQVLARDVGPAAYATLGALASHLKAGETGCWPSLTTLSAETGMARRTVIRALDTLEESGWIDRRRTSGKVTVYTLDFTRRSPATRASSTGSREGTGDISATSGGCSPGTPPVPPEHHEQDEGTRRKEQDEEQGRSELLDRLDGFDVPTLRELADAKGLDLLAEARACEAWHGARPGFHRKLAAPFPTLKSWIERAKPRGPRSERPVSAGTMQKFEALDRGAA